MTNNQIADELKDLFSASKEFFKDSLLSIYLVGTYETLFFREGSDIDIVYILNNSVPASLRSAHKKILSLYSLSIRFEVHLLEEKRIGLNQKDVDAYLLSSVLAWQGKLKWGKEIHFTKPCESETYTYNALCIIRGLEKSKSKETTDQNELIFYAIQVLEKRITWTEATSKSALLKFEIPTIWDLQSIRETCLANCHHWPISEDLKQKILNTIKTLG